MAYQYLPLPENHIRLLEILPGESSDRIKCRLRTVSTNALPAYSALSYVWGEDKTERPIWVDGKRLSIWPNLEAALFEFRRLPPVLNPISHYERVQHADAAIKALLSEIITPSVATEEFLELKRMIAEYHNLVAVFIKKRCTQDGIRRMLVPSEAGEHWKAANHKLEQIAIAAKEFTDPRSSSWLTTPRLLWIDAICINQQDMAERQSQIRIMGEVYLKASLLVIWLGPEQEGITKLFETLSTFLDQFLSRNTHLSIFVMRIKDMPASFGQWLALQDFSNEDMAILYGGFQQLFSSQWLKRGWTRQEYMFGALDFIPTLQRVLVACGSARARDIIDTAIALVPNRNKADETMYSMIVPPFESLFSGNLSFINALERSTSRRNAIDRKEAIDTPPVSKSEPFSDKQNAKRLLNLVAQSLFYQTTDPRDKIYSVLGIFQHHTSDIHTRREDNKITGLSRLRGKLYSVLDLFQQHTWGFHSRREDINTSGLSKLLTKYGHSPEALGGTLPKALLIDYNASVELVYSSFVKWVVDSTERLDIFLFWNSHYSKYATPSWCPDWTVDPIHCSMHGVLGLEILMNATYSSHDATPNCVSRVSFAKDLKTMTVRGFIWDVITREPNSFLEWTGSGKRYVWRPVGAIEFLIATCASKSSPSMRLPRSLYAELLECLSRDVDSKQAHDIEVLEFAKWCNLTIQEATSGYTISSEQPDVSPTPLSISSANLKKFENFEPGAIEHDVIGTTLTLTRDYHVVRPVYDLTQPGDLICVLLGCPMPMVVRPIDGHFVLLGQIHVPGIMQGEAMGALEAGTFKLRDFELH
ncbi:hypothetical protein VTL71DRAFT_7464 [Oculimacula yallundae]|uniref:Heterokaryon incompatibility domain-containing protein n=1 Tax=Oculimacula yallundae TaxID=86028 RepID=A0ABR4BVD8_9HELO